MTAEPRKLTPKESAALDAEYRTLVTKLEVQTQEQIAHLRRYIVRDNNIPQATRNRLEQILEQGGFKHTVFRVTDANVLSQNQVQVTYNIHDELYEYLRRPESLLPRELRGFLDGGIVLDPKENKPTAQDPSPLTGKTRTGVPEYDRLIDAQKKS